METGPENLDQLQRFMTSRDFVAGRAELIDFGFSSSRLKNWLQCGRLVQVARGVYSFGRDVETSSAARRAALLVAGAGSALNGRSALETWGVIRARRTIPTLINVAVEAGRATSHRGLSPALRQTRIEVVKRRFEPGDVRRKGGLPLTRVALALIDFAGAASAREVRFAFLEACRLRLFDRRDLRYCHRRIFRRRGSAKLRPLLALWVPELQRIRSVLEGLFLLAWVERGLPMPKVNVKLFGREVDFYWQEHRQILELDGSAFHSDRLSQKRDREKTSFLEQKGLTVNRATWKQVDQDMDAVIDRMAAQLTPTTNPS